MTPLEYLKEKDIAKLDKEHTMTKDQPNDVEWFHTEATRQL